MTNAALQKLDEKYGVEIVDNVPVRSDLKIVKNKMDFIRDDCLDQDMVGYSEPMEKLFAFLKECGAEFGVELRQDEQSRAYIHFTPGLEIKERDPERYQAAEYVAGLFKESRKDFHFLIKTGAIDLPKPTIKRGV